MTQKFLYTVIALFLMVITACSGSLRGIVRDNANRVALNYSDSQIGSSCDLQVVMPEGEAFKGRVELGTQRTQYNPGSTVSMDRYEAVETFVGNAETVMSGNRGNMMQCRFYLTDVILGFRSGGFGICQLSDGRVIDVYY
jgi:hypothetical protein